MSFEVQELQLSAAWCPILYAELDKKTVVYHLINGKTIEASTIRTGFSEAVQELLQDNRFTMCGTSMAVNLYYIHIVDHDTLVFTNSQKAYIGRRASRELRSVWSDFWMNREGIK